MSKLKNIDVIAQKVKYTNGTYDYDTIIPVTGYLYSNLFEIDYLTYEKITRVNRMLSLSNGIYTISYTYYGNNAHLIDGIHNPVDGFEIVINLLSLSPSDVATEQDDTPSSFSDSTNLYMTFKDGSVERTSGYNGRCSYVGFSPTALIGNQTFTNTTSEFMLGGTAPNHYFDSRIIITKMKGSDIITYSARTMSGYDDDSRAYIMNSAGSITMNDYFSGLYIKFKNITNPSTPVYFKRWNYTSSTGGREGVHHPLEHDAFLVSKTR